MVSSMEQIILKAKELGKLIQADETYLAMAKAKEMVDADTKLQDMIGEFNLSKMSLNQELSKEDRDQQKVTDLDTKIRTLHGEIMQNPNMVLYSETQEELDTIISKINAILSASLNGMDPETADEMHSCGGSCSSCAGCH